MSETDLIALARTAAKECEERGFYNTATAMRDVIADMVLALDASKKGEIGNAKKRRCYTILG